MEQQQGGSFAPPLTDDLLTKYRKLFAAVDKGSQLREALDTLLECCEHWWGLPESTEVGTQHSSGVGSIVKLDGKIAESLWDKIPWETELNLMSNKEDNGMFDALPKGDLRNASFHCLWHVRELDLDREPITKDKL